MFGSASDGSASTVSVEQFARVYVDDASALPPGADCYKTDRGFYYRLGLDTLSDDAATELVAKARQQFDVEVVHQVRDDAAVIKERRYVSSVDDVPEDYHPERGPKGGIYYETQSQDGSLDPATGAASETVGYEGEPVLAVQFEDVAVGDRVAFENPATGERDMGVVADVDTDDLVVSVESGDGQSLVAPANFEAGVEKTHEDVEPELPDVCRSCEMTAGRDRMEGSMQCPHCHPDVDPDSDEYTLATESLKSEGGETGTGDGEGDSSETLMSSTPGVHNARYSEDDDDAADADEDRTDPQTTASEPDDAATAKDRGGRHVGSTAKAADGEGVWTYYYGPDGGEGWMNLQTGEIRYQQQRPGPAPQDGDGYDDWLEDGWTSPPEDPAALDEGQAAEFYDEDADEYRAGDIYNIEETADGVVYGVEADDDKHVVYPEDLTAVEDLAARFDDYFADNDFDRDDYWAHIHDEVPDSAPAEVQALDATGTYELDFANGAEEVAFAGYQDENAPQGKGGFAVHYDDVPDDLTDINDPEDVGPTMLLPNGTIEDMVVDYDDVSEAAEPPADWEQVGDLDGISEGDPISYETPDGEWVHSEVHHVDETGDVQTADNHFIWPESMDVRVPEGVAADLGAETGAAPGVESAEDAVGQPVDDDAGDAESAVTAGWEDWTADYDMGDYDATHVEEWGDLGDFGFPGGVTAHNMEVGALPSWDGEGNDGLVFKTEYGPNGETDSLGHRQMVTYTLGDALGANIPEHVGHPETEGYVVAEGVEGADIGSAPSTYIDQVDPDEFIDQAARQVILGNNDAHHQNVKVTPDGGLVFHDIDHSAGDITSNFTGQKPQYDDAIDRTLGELYRSGQYATGGDEMEFRQQVMERAERIARDELMTPDGEFIPELRDAFENATDYDNDLRENVRSNIENLAAGEVDY